MHVRQQIREQAATELTGLTTTGANVFQSRSRTLQESQLPALRIYTRNEASERIDLNNQYARKVELIVECIGRTISDVDDLCDTMAAEVETAIGASKFGGLAIDYPELVTTDTEYIDEPNQPIGVVTLRFTVQYMTIGNLPEASSI